MRAALEANPETTAAELADIAGIGASTARRILARWSTTGTVKRLHRTNARGSDRWTIFLEPETTASATESSDDTAEDCGTAGPNTEIPEPDHDATTEPGPETPSQPATDPTTDTESGDGDGSASADKPEKLAPGALRGQVEDHLRDNPDGEFTPHQIGKALERSSGAVHNALVKLTETGIATQTSTAPKKFRLATT
ncbi:hypothetical protein DMB37_15625 [Nocardia sp. CS682]|nr:hypothetical protein DMB37_15625 [Nocardia sp. CS682]